MASRWTAFRAELCRPFVCFWVGLCRPFVCAWAGLCWLWLWFCRLVLALCCLALVGGVALAYAVLTQAPTHHPASGGYPVPAEAEPAPTGLSYVHGYYRHHGGGRVHVHGYYRHRGGYVHAYYRRAPRR